MSVKKVTSKDGVTTTLERCNVDWSGIKDKPLGEVIGGVDLLLALQSEAHDERFESATLTIQITPKAE